MKNNDWEINEEIVKMAIQDYRVLDFKTCWIKICTSLNLNNKFNDNSGEITVQWVHSSLDGKFSHFNLPAEWWKLLLKNCDISQKENVLNALDIYCLEKKNPVPSKAHFRFLREARQSL